VQDDIAGEPACGFDNDGARGVAFDSFQHGGKARPRVDGIRALALGISVDGRGLAMPAVLVLTYVRG
jgi:hypothetical protein